MSKTIFDPQLGAHLATEGAQISWDHSAETFKDTARQTILDVARMRLDFTTDDIIRWVETHNLPAPDNNSAWGHIIKQLAKNGHIVFTGNYRTSARANAHSKPLRVWRRA
jgi:hypothetical protein